MKKSMLDLLKEQILGKTFIQDFGDPNIIDKYKILDINYDGQGSNPRLLIQFEESKEVLEKPITFFYSDFLDD